MCCQWLYVGVPSHKKIAFAENFLLTEKEGPLLRLILPPKNDDSTNKIGVSDGYLPEPTLKPSNEINSIGEFSGWEPLVAWFGQVLKLGSGKKHVQQSLKIVNDYVAGIASTAEIHAESVEQFLIGLKSQGKMPKTIISAKSCISTFCDFLKSKNWLERNPCHDVKCRRPDKVAPPVIHSDTRIEELFAVAEKCDLRNQVVVCIWAGLRLSEMIRLRWMDIDFHNKVLLVYKAKSKEPRIVSMCDQVLEVLADQKAKTGHLTYVFAAKRTWSGHWKYLDKPYSQSGMNKKIKPLQAVFPEFQQLAGHSVGRGYHLLRHTFATRLAGANVNVKQIQDWMGHSDIKMTERYIHLRRVYNPEIEKVMG